MENTPMEKKIAAAMAAVTAYLAQEAAAAAQPCEPDDTPAPVQPMRLWGISGRSAQMQNRTLMQMRTFLR